MVVMEKKYVLLQMKEDTRQNKIITTVWGVGYKIEK